MTSTIRRIILGSLLVISLFILLFGMFCFVTSQTIYQQIGATIIVLNGSVCSGMMIVTELICLSLETKADPWRSYRDR